MSTPSQPASPVGVSPGGADGGTGGGERADAPSPHPSSPGGRSLPALVAAAVLVVGAIALVLIFGVARPPELATVREDPTPSPEASLAWTEWEGRDSCIHTVDPQGTPTEVVCGYEGRELLAWTDQGIVVMLPGPPGVAEVIDPDTGAVVGQLDADPEGWFEPRGGAVRSRHVDGTLTVTLRETGAELWQVEAPENYRIDDGVRSPDGRWVVLVDRSERLLLVPADGSAEPRVWAEAGEGWVHPLWEGSSLPSTEGS